jgi:hypothetical protein
MISLTVTMASLALPMPRRACTGYTTCSGELKDLIASSLHVEQMIRHLLIGFLFSHSASKKSMIKGMIKLYAFVKALERDYMMVMRGVPIRYSTQLKKQINVSQLIGWTKPTKRQRAATKEKAEISDRRPPDTTEALLGKSNQPLKRIKLGRPANSPNLDKNPYTTYISYSASPDPKRKNICWLASTLEALYAVYSPLWLREPGGRPTNLFHGVVSHFAA